LGDGCTGCCDAPMTTEIPADDADARALAPWKLNTWTIAVELGMAP